MAVQLNHTIVNVLDPEASSRFLADLLGLPAPHRFGPFMVVELANGVSLDFIVATKAELIIEHYAFLVSEPEFDAIFARIRERGLPYWSDPAKREPGRINHHDGGRGVYWDDPN